MQRGAEVEVDETTLLCLCCTAVVGGRKGEKKHNHFESFEFWVVQVWGERTESPDQTNGANM